MVYVIYVDLKSSDGKEKKKLFNSDQEAWNWIKKHDGKDIDFRASNINSKMVKDFKTKDAWTDKYAQFERIINKNFGKGSGWEKKISDEVDKLYKSHKGDKEWDEAYRRWKSDMNTQDSKTMDLEKPYFDPMYKDTRRAVVKEVEKYLASKGCNNSTGTYDKIVFGVRSLLEKTLLHPGTPKFNDAVHREADRLLKKYNLTKDDNLVSKSSSTLKKMLKEAKEKGDKEAARKISAVLNTRGIYPRGKGPSSVKDAQQYANTLSDAKKIVAKLAKLEERYVYERKQGNIFYFSNTLGDDVGMWDANKKIIKMYDAKTTDSTEVLQTKNGYTLGVNNGKLVLAFKGESLEHPHMWLGDAKNKENMRKAVQLFDEFANSRKVKDEQMEKEYSYSIKIGGDLKRVKVKANNSEEALAKVKAEAIRFKADRVKTKFDNNKLSTRDLR